MIYPRWMLWAGLAAIVGGLTAIVLTPPFATAYFLAFPGEDPLPFWFDSDSLEPRLDLLMTLSSGDGVYETYGRVYNLVYLLFLPAVFVLHHLLRESGSRLEKRGFVVLVVGLVATFVGVAGDYWADGIGFGIEVLGLLTMAIGVTMYGVAIRRASTVPRWCAWMFIACGPGAFAFMALIGHIPSGPTFPFALTWIAIGFMLLFKKVGLRSPPL